MNNAKMPDMDEMVLQLHRQLAYAFNLASARGDASGMYLTRVNARMGRKEKGEAGDTSPGGPVSDDLAIPGEGDWEVEVEYARDNRNNLGGSRIPGGPKLPVLLTLFEDLPLKAIKGIRYEWAARFNQLGINSIGSLADSGITAVAKICNHYSSLRPMEFFTMVSLLERPYPPLPAKGGQTISLRRLVLMGPEELPAALGLKLSDLEVRELIASVQIMNLVMDRAYFIKFNTDLFKA